jgi:large subunit ribosomal protein L22
MESTAHLRNFRMAPRKISLVADLVRGKQVGAALNILQFTKRAAARPLVKLIKSAVANATDLSKGEVDIDTLYVKTISVDQGPTQKRFMPRAMGRANPIQKKSSHVHVTLAAAAKRRK